MTELGHEDEHTEDEDECEEACHRRNPCRLGRHLSLTDPTQEIPLEQPLRLRSIAWFLSRSAIWGHLRSLSWPRAHSHRLQPPSRMNAGEGCPP